MRDNDNYGCPKLGKILDQERLMKSNPQAAQDMLNRDPVRFHATYGEYWNAQGHYVRRNGAFGHRWG